jgi:hypothetical protein
VLDASTTNLRAEVEGWDQGRWVAVLDRMEHRQAGVGLRFWGPPLWLEVTMTGPDSDAWATASAGGEDDQSWDWQAEEACDGASLLVSAGAADDDLLDLVSRYTLQNLVLNATHEVGEWLRFDTRRIFAAHLPADGAGDRLLGPGQQGNGSVKVTVDFGPPVAASAEASGSRGAEGSRPQSTVVPGAVEAGVEVARRAAAVAAGWRFTFLPGTEITLDPDGPAVAGAWSWATGWSPSTVAGLALDDDAFVDAVQRDVHRMLIRAEVHRICDAFHVDGRAPWYLAPGDDRERRSGSLGQDPGSDPTDAGRQPVSVRLRALA